MLCFTTGDVILVVLVRYLIDYIHVPPGFDSLFLVIVLSFSLISIPGILALMRRTNKRIAYLIGIGFMVGVLTVAIFWGRAIRTGFWSARGWPVSASRP